LKKTSLDKTKLGKYYTPYSNRTTVPENVRKLLQIEESDLIEWVFNDEKYTLEKAPSEEVC
jgi:succinate dehydrogenase flavin-adding protein (antitoxin of CptAB toxin-antitoxin module)